MKEKTVKLYYCEYCKKHMHSKSAMERHEKYCTMNPNRQCRMCDWIIDHSDDDFANDLNAIKEIVKATIPDNEDIYLYDYKDQLAILEKIKISANYCPTCVFAALRQLNKHYSFSSCVYDFKKDWQNKFDDRKDYNGSY